MIARSPVAVLIAVCIACIAPAAVASPAAVGRKAPSFELESLAGDPVPSTAFKGHALYVNLFATWCPPCRGEMPMIARTLPKFAGKVTFLAVDAQEPAVMIKPYLAKLGVTSPIAIDHGQFAASYGATSIPESVFIDRAGMVRAIVHGPISERALRANLALIAKP